MRKWAAGLENQRKENGPRSSASPDAASTDFAWTRSHASTLENPYLQQDDDEEEEDDDDLPTAASQFPMPGQPVGGIVPRTNSNTSLRQRSVTGESTQSLAGMVRAAAPRFPLPVPPAPLSLQTQGSGLGSPGSRGGDSYFSPIADSPASSRTSTTSGMFPPTSGYPFPKSGTQPVWDDNNRYTAPALPRAPSRDGTSPGQLVNGRNPRGPSLPAMTNPQSALQQQRSRSYSTPDINGPGTPRQRQPSQGTVPAVPGIPQHLHHPAHDSNIPRSQTGSPRNDMPTRANTQSPGVQRERMHQHQHSGSINGPMAAQFTPPLYSRNHTPGPGPNGLRVDAAMANSRTVTPALGTSTLPTQPATPAPNAEVPMPTQLKVRVNCDGGNYVTLVVAFNITYQSLIDRIDAKLARFTSSSIGKGVLKLRYRDEDGDLVTIQSDDDIQIAFMEWREGLRSMYSGGVGEIELFCVG